MQKRSDLEPYIVEEWLKRPESKRTGNDVLEFHGYLSKHKSTLLGFKCKGDKYQFLKTILRNHISIREQKKYSVALHFTDGSPSITHDVSAVSDADAINTAKWELSIGQEGGNYKQIMGAETILE